MNALNNALNLARAKHAFRVRQTTHARGHGRAEQAGLGLVDFTNNDYLNLSTHPAVVAAFIEAAHHYGASSGSSPQLSGTSEHHEALELEFAAWLSRKRALFFNSGYHANLAVYTVLASRNSVIFSDKHVHASTLDGIQLSRAKHVRFQHHDLHHLDELLTHTPAAHRIITTESVFSMDGSITDVAAIAELAHKHDAILCVDDAHGLGVLSNPRVRFEAVPCLIQPLGKALGGMGAIVSGDDDLIEALQQFSRSYRYSTALPASIPAALRAALHALQTEPKPLADLQRNIQHFNTSAKQRGLTVMCNDETPIRTILTGSNENTLHLQQILREAGYWVAAIRPPTVPAGTSRLRFSLCSEHTLDDITHCLDVLASAHEG